MSPSVTATAVKSENDPPAYTEEVELSVTEGYDDEQIRLMEEVCIVIDENDQPLRPGTKKECTVHYFSFRCL
jgi:isopentenyl-diphosphate Delta-isomerase